MYKQPTGLSMPMLGCCKHLPPQQQMTKIADHNTNPLSDIYLANKPPLHALACGHPMVEPEAVQMCNLARTDAPTTRVSALAADAGIHSAVVRHEYGTHRCLQHIVHTPSTRRSSRAPNHHQPSISRSSCSRASSSSSSSPKPSSSSSKLPLRAPLPLPLLACSAPSSAILACTAVVRRAAVSGLTLRCASTLSLPCASFTPSK
ncbi:hypothetical protein COO60DRAFT_524844 [Scenedesmus sp. NREL 46B-D3]|nr:hypothetical protein COO60DRAFT_524844 [Scenedesmus sp. NREL 46B-D3]